MEARSGHLLIVSDLAHFTRDQNLVAWGPTVREFSALATIFRSIRLIAPLHTGAAPESTIEHRSRNLQVVPIAPAGGDSLSGKMDVLRASRAWLQTIRSHLAWADVIHVRFPSNIGAVCIPNLMGDHRPSTRWFKFAGSWRPTRYQSRSARIQKWWLRHHAFHRGVVTVNGRQPNDPPHIADFLNPCFFHDELLSSRQQALAKELTSPIRLLYVGALSRQKGVLELPTLVSELSRLGIDAELTIVGDGPCRDVLEAEFRVAGGRQSVSFAGAVPRSAIGGYYEKAHFLVHPSYTEGWPKVLSEAMAYGAIPLATNISNIRSVLRSLTLGSVVPIKRPDLLAQAVRSYLVDPERWRRERTVAVNAASKFTYEAYLNRLQAILNLESEPGDSSRGAAHS